MANKSSNQWWGVPTDFDDRKNERKISWLELFYDLVYVAGIGQLTRRIASYPTWQSVGSSLLLFGLIFWSWVNGSEYHDLHGGDGIRTRILTFLQMLAVAAVAITIPEVYEGRLQGFAISFATVQLLIIYIWWSVGLYDPSHRVFNRFYTATYGAAFIVLLLSIFTSGQLTFLLWAIVLLLNLAAPLIVAPVVVEELNKRGQVFSASATIVERFGVFTIIVLTESILSVVGAVSDVKDKHPMAWVVFILGILIAFLLWSIYFDMTSEQETKKGYKYLLLLVFLHFPLMAALSVAGACLKVLISSLGTNLSATVQWLFCLSISVILLTITGITKIMGEYKEDRAYIVPVSRWLILVAILMMAIPLAGINDSIIFLGMMAVLLFIPVFIGTRIWVKHKFFS